MKVAAASAMGTKKLAPQLATVISLRETRRYEESRQDRDTNRDTSEGRSRTRPASVAEGAAAQPGSAVDRKLDGGMQTSPVICQPSQAGAVSLHLAVAEA